MGNPPTEHDVAWIRARADRLCELDPSLDHSDALAKAAQERADAKARNAPTKPRKPLTVTLKDIIEAAKK